MQSSVGSSYFRTGRIYYDAPGERVVYIDEVYENDEEISAYEDYFFFKQVSNISYQLSPFISNSTT